VDAARDLALDEANEGRLIDFAVAEWSHKRRKDALEQRLGHDLCKLP
jgi:hypothetical protein